MSEALMWWGYLHTNNTVQVKRFFDYRDIREAQQSDFVVKTTLPFSAANRQDAMRKAASTLIHGKGLGE